MSSPSVTIKLDVVPSYAAGHLFSWTLDPGFVCRGTPAFVVERAETPDGPWSAVSPALQGVYFWRSDRLLGPKDPVLHFRVTMTVAGVRHSSPVRMPYGELNRREFLIVAELMRKELLAMRTMSGVPAQLFMKSVFGEACPVCRDPVTGDVVKQNCKRCFGVGRLPGYHGPYDTWAVISPAVRQKKMEGDQTATKEPYGHSVRLLGTPRVKKDDILVDVRSDKRYYVDTIDDLAEIRRIPVVQNVTAFELASSSPLFRLGVDP